MFKVMFAFISGRQPEWKRGISRSSFSVRSTICHSSEVENLLLNNEMSRLRSTDKSASQMNQPLLLHVVERLEGLIGKLPAAIQKPILSELTPLKELFCTNGRRDFFLPARTRWR